MTLKTKNARKIFDNTALRYKIRLRQMVACPKEIAWKIGTETKQKIRKPFTKETYWHKGIRVSYGFGGKYWKFDLIVNNLMDRLQEDFGLPEALSKIESSQNAEKEYDEYMKVF